MSSSTAKSFSVNLESPIKAIALNRDASQVVAAGRNLIRIFSIEEDKFTEKENLRFSKRNSQFNGACTDVAWNPSDESILATATTAGAVCVWNLPNNSTVRQDIVFTEHRRTANRVNFHPREPNLLLSGSQDATAILFDLRAGKPQMLFKCEEAVRDVRFNPHHPQQFAVCLENGNVQFFDCRSAEVCSRELTCHAGPVFQCDFHPAERQLLATCGRDKCIKVWSLAEESKNPAALDTLVPTIAAMGAVAWRPQRRHYLASSALVTDFSVSVWDLRRPFVPFATFEKHTDTVTSLVWRDDPHVLLAGSKDGWLTQFAFKDAKRPADKVNPVGMDIGCSGDMAVACGVKIAQGEGRHLRTRVDKLFKKETRADEFHRECASQLMFYPHDTLQAPPLLSMEWFVSCARGYLLQGRSVSELCNHNAGVAQRAGREQVALVWRVVAFLYSMNDTRLGKAPHSHSTANTPHRHTSGARDDVHLHSRTDDSGSMGEGMGLYDATFPHQHHPRTPRSLSARDAHPLNLEPPSSGVGAGDFLFNEHTVFEEMDTPFAGFETIHDEEHWQLPAEGFQVRTELPDRSQERADSALRSKDKDMLRRSERDRNRSGSLGPDEAYEDALRLGNLAIYHDGGGCIDLSERVQETLHFHAEQGDLQTAVTLLVVLGERAKGMVSEMLLEAWILDYIELLSRFQLFTVANEIIKLCQVAAVGELNQQSTTVYANCNMCGRHLQRTGWYCSSCRRLTNACSICQLPVRGLYVWCQGCAHGGHLPHLQEWFKKSTQCPTGCGHHCEYI